MMTGNHPLRFLQRFSGELFELSQKKMRLNEIDGMLLYFHMD